MKARIFLQLGAGLIVGIALVLISTQVFTQPYSYQGSLINPSVRAPDFTLETTDSRYFQPNDHLGKIILLYFGYTFCPDVCPTTLYDLTRVKKNLGDLSKEIVVAMVTVDPDRDTPDILGPYVKAFDPTFYGLSGDIDALHSVWSAYGVYQAQKQVEGGTVYLIDHTARVYVIDRQGNLRMTFPFGMSWKAMADDLSHLLAE